MTQVLDVALAKHHPTHREIGGKDSMLADYDLIRRSIEYLTLNWRSQPSLEDLADHIGLSQSHMQRLFTHWTGGLSPKGFIQAVTLDHAKQLLDQSASVMDAAFEVGLSGPSRLHDLFVTHEAITPGIYKAKGQGLTIRYGFHACPFGVALAMITEQGGLAGMAFCDAGKEQDALDDMMSRWPKASYICDQAATQPYIERSFDMQSWQQDQPLRITMIGTDFEVRVWETLLSIPMGHATSYSEIAKKLGNPKASRAVGAAVGRNPISFVVPCHRVMAKSGKLCGYHWGLTRKQAMLGWEKGHLPIDGTQNGHMHQKKSPAS